MSLSIASHGEHLVVAMFGQNEDVAVYFQAVVFFLMPGVMFNQYTATVFGPYLRQNKNIVIDKIVCLYKYGLLSILVVFIVLLLIGYLLEVLVIGSVSTSIPMAVVLVLTSCVRLIYILPSSFVGILGSRDELRFATIAYLMCSLLLPLLSWLFLSSGVGIMISVATANLINWSLRSCVGIGVMRRIIHSNTDLR